MDNLLNTLFLSDNSEFPNAPPVVPDSYRAKEFKRSDLYEALVEAQSDLGQAVVLVDAVTQKCLYANDAIYDLFGYAPEEFINFPTYFILAAPEEEPRLTARLRQRLAGEKVPGNYEITAVKKDGTRFPVEVAVKLSHTAEHSLLVILLRDLSEHRRAEAERAELIREQAKRAEAEAGEARYRLLAEAIQHMVWTALPDGTTDYLNQRWHTYTNASSAEIYEWGWLAKIHPDDLAKTVSQWQVALKAGSCFEVEFRIRRDRDQSYRWHLGRAVCLQNAAGDILKWFGTCTDIHYKKELEETLRSSEEHFRFVADSAPVMLWMLRKDGTCTFMNKFWCEFVGRSLGNELGDGWKDHLHPDEREAHLTEASNLRALQKDFRQEYRLRRFDGQFRWILDCAVPRYNADGNFIGYIGSSIDITERKIAEEELKTQKDELSRSNADLQQFAYVASHDLKEPLRMVSSYLSLLAKRYAEKLDENANDYISFAVDGAQRMNSLIEDLLAYSRVGTGSSPGAPIDCNVVVAEVLKNLEPMVSESGVKVDVGALPVVKGDRRELLQLFQNLLGNAIKFRSLRSPFVRVTAQRRDHAWEFAITDNGIGIEPEYGERIFVIFQRLHSRERYSGTGIGLAICKKIVERLGGRIWVESELDKGSTFGFTLTGVD